MVFATSVVMSLNTKDGYCLGRVGNEMAQEEFRACTKKNCISSGHVGSGVFCMDLPLKDSVWAIKVGKSEKALGTNPQVFNNPTPFCIRISPIALINLEERCTNWQIIWYLPRYGTQVPGQGRNVRVFAGGR